MLSKKSKRFFRVLYFFILFYVFSVNSYSFSITEKEEISRYIVKLGDNISHLMLMDGFSKPSLIAEFNLSSGIVYVLQEQPKGNACSGGKLHIIWAEFKDSFRNGYRKMSSVIDHCGGYDPEISLIDGYLKVHIKPYKNSRWSSEDPTLIPGETWMYKPEWN